MERSRDAWFKGSQLISFLVILSSGEQRLVSSPEPSIIIGRRADCDVSIADPVVSRMHAKVFLADGRYFVQDLGSRNGTALNGVPVTQPAELAPGDSITVGATTVVFEPAKAPPSLEERDVSEPALSVSIADEAGSGEGMKEAAGFLEAVADVARRVAQNGPVEGLLDSILKLCVERTSAERAGVLLVDGHGELVPRAYLSTTSSTSPFAISKSIARKAMQENRGVLIRDVANDKNMRDCESVISLRIRSAICIPLWNGEKTIGVLYLDTSAPNRQFGEMDLHFFSTLSGMIAEKIENAILTDIASEKQRLDKELAAAREIQSRLFPKALPYIEGYDLAAYNRPCKEVGGDYFDIIATGAECGFVIADVVGKGIGPAILMSNLQAMVKSLAAETPDSSRLLKRINADLSGRVGESVFITCCYLVLSPREGVIRYANAGHNPPLLYRRSGEFMSLEASGIPLGIFADSDYGLASVSLNAGDVLLLYTDGVTECVNAQGELFGESGLRSVLERFSHLETGELRAAICSTMDTFRGSVPFNDDVTFVVVKRRAENS